MDEEGFLDSSRPAGDPVGGGSHRRSRSGGDWVDNEGAMGRGHVRPNMGLDLGSGFGAADAQAGQGEPFSLTVRACLFSICVSI